MSFSDNLRALRKKEGMSQEHLAEKLNVSRQAVSKWESDQGYPEMDTLIQISNLFHCSIDHLIKETIVESTLEEIHFKTMYDTHYKKFSLYCTAGIASILSGVSFYLLLSIFFKENTKAEIIPTSIFLGMVAIGVICFIIGGIQQEEFVKKHRDIPKDLYTTLEKDQFHKHFGFAIASGVGFIILGVILQILVETLLFDEIANFVFMTLVCFAVSIFVYFGTQKEKFEMCEKQKEEREHDFKNEKKKELIIGSLCGIIMILATIIFFVWSFVFDAWEISWLIFPIGGMICGIVVLVIELIFANK